MYLLQNHFNVNTGGCNLITLFRYYIQIQYYIITLLRYMLHHYIYNIFLCDIQSES